MLGYVQTMDFDAELDVDSARKFCIKIHFHSLEGEIRSVVHIVNYGASFFHCVFEIRDRGKIRRYISKTVPKIGVDFRSVFHAVFSMPNIPLERFHKRGLMTI